MSESVQMLRHSIATVAYRAGKVLRGVPPEFAQFRAAPDTRTPGELLAHLADLFDWALALANGERTWHDSPAADWERGAARFFDALTAFDARLAAETPLACSAGKLFQGPVADALTHIGQIAMLRRMAGVPIRGENYFVAAIAVGHVGAEQPAPRREFD